MSGADEWWREAVVYHIYPRSFQDSDGDGVGDLQGILERLDHLNDGSERSLGVDAIWLSPIFPSPQADWGYDVAGYTDVDPAYGDLETLDRLVAACHQRGVRLILDLVLNHTSEEHPWFRESRRSRTSPRRDWYLWRDPAPAGGPPNNWDSVFGGPAWTFDEGTGQYYMHSYLASQPDLNWRNPEVVAALGDVIRFWLARGIDGFRLDAVSRLMKHPEVADDPPDREGDPASPRGITQPGRYLRPELAGAVRAIRRVVDEFPGRVLIGEVWAPASERAFLYGPPALDGLNLLFDFDLIRRGPENDASYVPWRADVIAAALAETQRGLPSGALPSYALGNHDVSRLASRLDVAAEGGRERVRAAALLHLALPGPPCLYAGEEIGMVDVPVPEERRLDPVGRDPERTPMQWDRSPERGFTTAEPWLPFGPLEIDVASQRDAGDSLLTLYRRAIWTRRRVPALLRGALVGVEASDDVLTFERKPAGGDDPAAFVVLSTAGEPREPSLPSGSWELLLGSDPGVSLAGDALSLPPYAAAWLLGRQRAAARASATLAGA